MVAIQGLVGSVWELRTIVVPASTTKTIYSVPFASFHALKFILSAYNDTESKNRTLEMIVSKQGVGTVRQAYGRIGTGLGMSLTDSVSAGTFSLDLTNTETFDITASLGILVIT